MAMPEGDQDHGSIAMPVVLLRPPPARVVAKEKLRLSRHQVELGAGRLHVRRVKNGSPGVIRCKATKYALYGAYSATR
jgi:hypothetical protein